MPFGLHSAPKVFSTVDDAQQWILESKGVTNTMQYLDDFLPLGLPTSPVCKQVLDTTLEWCLWLGMPVVTHDRRPHDKTGTPGY